MKFLLRNKIVWVLAVTAILMFAVSIQAGMRYGRGAGGYYDCPFANRGYEGTTLTDEQLKRIDTQREAFQAATRGIQDNLYAKELELQAELAKNEPQLDKVKSLQKEISALNSQLDEKWAEHVIEMKKINPNAGRGYASECPRGYGRGYHRGYGNGPRGNCWN